MKPDAYMPFYGGTFFGATEGKPDHIIVGYLRAIWFYWSHEHCRGLENDSETLRKICRIDREDWTKAEAIIFDNDKFFTLGADGLWHQKRADEEWEKSNSAYQKAVSRGHAGAVARWKSKHPRSTYNKTKI